MHEKDNLFTSDFFESPDQWRIISASKDRWKWVDRETHEAYGQWSVVFFSCKEAV